MTDDTLIKNINLTNQSDNTLSQIKNIIESIDVGTWEWNIQTGEMFFSNKWAQITGYNLEELGPINSSVIERITHPDDFKKSRELLEKHFMGILPYYKYEHRIKHKDGYFIWICERGGVISRTEDGKPLIMFGTHTDITTKKRIEESLENYIHTLNHDLKNPLSLVNGYSSFLIEEDCSKEEVRKYASMISNTGNKMMKMMESYLLLAKIERGQQIQNKVEKSISEIKDIIYNIYNNLKKDKDILFKVENSSLSDSLLLDEILFDSMISNLLNNAIEASSKIDGKIVITIGQDDEYASFDFYNSGEIPKEIEKKLFKKFISSKSHGTGIGLYSSRLIARAHGGEIVYHQEKGGTRFNLKLPLL